MEDKKEIEEIEEKSYGSENLSDLTLIVDNTHFKVHKAILANQSDVFASLFTKDENTINLSGRTNHSPKNFDRFLKEIYEGNISKDDNVLFLVDFYNVKSLIEKWDSYMINQFPKSTEFFRWSRDEKELNSLQKSLLYLTLLEMCKRYKLNKALNHGIYIFVFVKNTIKKDLGVHWERGMKNLDKDLLFMLIDSEMK